METPDHPSIAKVAAELREAGHNTSAQRITSLPADVRTAEQAARALDVEVGAIANSLIFRCRRTASDDTPLLALTSGAHRADTTTLAALADASDVTQADPDFVRQSTGQSIGGVAPLGHPQKLLTVVDLALRRYPTIWAAAGHPKSVFPTTFDDLLRITGGRAADVTTTTSPDLER